MHKSFEMYENEKTLVWWVSPIDAFTQSEPHEQDSFFDPANDKPYRHATDFKVVSLMRELKSRKNESLAWTNKQNLP